MQHTGSDILRPLDLKLHGSTQDVAARRTRARVAAGALDAVVRAYRSHQPGLETLVERSWELLKQEPTATLVLGATHCEVDAESALDADAERGRWLLPAFMAGLRSLTVEPDSHPADVAALAQALGSLRCVPDELEEFADFIWSDGLEGVRAELHTSFAEVLDFPDDPVRAVAEIQAIRAEMAESLTSALRVTTRDLDAAVLLAEFQAPLDTFSRHAQAGELTLPPDALTRLRDASESAGFWARQEILLAVAYPALRPAMSPRALAKDLVHLIGESTGQFLGLITALAGQRDDFARTVLATLEEQGIGESIAAHVSLDRLGAEELAQVIRSQADELAAGVVRGLIERAQREGPACATFAAKMARLIGEPRWMALLQPDKVAAEARLTMVQIALNAGFAANHLHGLIASLPGQDALTLMEQLPPEGVPALETAVLQILRQASPHQRTLLAGRVVQHGTAGGRRQLARQLLDDHGGGWELRAIRQVAQAAAGLGLGDELLALQRDPHLPVPMRIVLLDALVACEPTADAALKWRAAELLDAPEIRSRLVELRRGRK